MLPTTDEIFAALRTCRIPEIPVNLGKRGLFHGEGMEAPLLASLGYRGCPPSRPTNCPTAPGIAGAGAEPGGEQVRLYALDVKKGCV